MRLPRLKAPAEHPVAYYHCISRVVDRRFVLEDLEKEHFLKLMRFYERFCKVRIVSYCLMSNHFHLLVEVPRKPGQLPSEVWLIEHVRCSYGKGAAMLLEQDLRQIRKQAGDDAAQKMLEGWFARLWDVSAFMKILKQRFTQWFNKNNKRRGTLWEDRFRSMIVQSGEALGTMAAYIEINPVRAGMVADPADYRWSSYGAAMGGDKAARKGLQAVVETVDQQLAKPAGTSSSPERWLAQYRVWMFGSAEEIKDRRSGRVLRKGLTPEKIEAVLKNGGRVMRWELLRCRLRYLSKGGVLGTRAFVEQIFQSERWRFSPNRQEGAKSLRGGDSVWSGLRTLRAPRWTAAG
ncbi:MAG: transposase [Verrucomicrobiaceae bacterium]